MGKKKPLHIDYLNTYGGGFNTNSIGSVIKDIMAIKKQVQSEHYYTYNATTTSQQINLFNTTSQFYKRFTKFLNCLPYRVKKGVFKTMNYKMVVYIILYVLKRTFRNNKNLIIVYNGQPIIFWVLKKMIRPKRLIFICHGGSLRVYNGEVGENEILRYADTIVTLNTHVYNEVSELHNHVYLIPNYVKDVKSNSALKNKKHFVFAGRIDTNKRVKEICQIFKDSFEDTDFKLKICGSGNSTYFNETLDIVESSENLEYLGYLDIAQVKELYSNSGYIILISASEGSPLCLNDSYNYNITPIGNTIPGIQDFIEAFGGIMLPESHIFEALEATFKAIRGNEEITYLTEQDVEKQMIFKKDYFESKYKEILT
ncbi:glycosyltransferase [Winogradskyella sp. A3E31]|uniref:glycosyltransferase n=1 Tax=Winogradskyella sp. A3E31 TaxID=3349637 RepID=UPI00398B112C